jgi:ATP-binding cassette subfamily C protein CydC
MRTLLHTVSPQRGERAWLLLSVLLAAAATGAAIALLATSGYLISRAAQRPLIISLLVAIVAVRAFGITRAVTRYCERLASHELALRQIARLRIRFFGRLVPLVPSQLLGTRSGELLSRFVSDVDTLQDAHLRVVIPAFVAMLVIVGASVAGWLMLPAAGVALLVALSAAAILTPCISAKVAAAAGRHQAPTRAQLTSQLVDAIDGSAELAVAGCAAEHAQRLDRSDAQLARLSRRDALAAGIATGLNSLVIGGGLVVVLAVGITGVRSGALPGVLLAAIAFLFLGACESVKPLPAAARRLRACSVAAERLQDICGQPPQVCDPAEPTRPTGTGTLEARAVRIRYSPDEQWVLDHGNLQLAAGERVALIGSSGAGKTTLAELFVRFHDPDEGVITLDGVDVRRLAQDDLRHAVLLCGQDAHLFNTTIRENLRIGSRETAEQELWAVLGAVELEDWARGLADGLDTHVGQAGELVSGGQRQRLALARALLSDARFLILDEPDAHLDAPLARRVMRGVLAHAGARGVLVITHATDGLEGYDRVLRLQDGALVAATPDLVY